MKSKGTAEDKELWLRSGKCYLETPQHINRRKNSDHIIPPEKYLIFYLDLRQNVSGSWQSTPDVAND